MGCEVESNFRKKSAKPKIAKYQIPIGSKAALARKPAIIIVTI